MKIDGLNSNVILKFANGITLSIDGIDSPANEYYDPFAGTADDVFADPTPLPSTEAFGALNAREQHRLLLEHYGQGNSTQFRQFDVFTNTVRRVLSDTMHPDEDGYCISRGDTYELMNGYWDVRCLINPELKKADVVRALRKVLESIESSASYDEVKQGGTS